MPSRAHYKRRTQDLGENVLIEPDDRGNLVSMTIEHAKQQMNVTEFSYQLAASSHIRDAHDVQS